MGLLRNKVLELYKNGDGDDSEKKDSINNRGPMLFLAAICVTVVGWLLFSNAKNANMISSSSYPTAQDGKLFLYLNVLMIVGR